MKASELIKELLKLVEQYGDRRVYAGGGDYPGEVDHIAVVKGNGDGYVPGGVFKISERD